MSEATTVSGPILTAGAFVGRQRERQELAEAWQRVLAGKGGLLLLTGEPGIGKTRLASELSDEAAATGACVLWGRCWEGGGAPAYWPWLQVLRSCELNVASAATLLAPSEAEQLRHLAATVAAPTSSPSTSEHARFRFFDAVMQYLRAASRRQPLLVVMDDLHAADEPSLQLLHFVARELVAARVLVVATYRDSEVALAPALARVLPALAREGSHLHLRGLSESEVAICVGAVIRQSAPRSLVAAIHQVTEGNPFFVESIARVLVAEGRLSPDACDLANFQMPDEVREAVRQRISRLGDNVRAVLEIAAVCGREFEEGVLGRVLARVPSGQALSSFALSLERACRGGIIQEVADHPGCYSFVHSLVADTLCQWQEPRARAEAHCAVAAAIEQSPGESADLRVAQLAHHYLAAGRYGDMAKAISYAEQAGRRALQLYGYEEATQWYERALRALEKCDRDEETACRLLVALAESLRCTGDIQSAVLHLHEAADRARNAALPELVAAASLAMSSCLSETGEVNETLVAWLREALRLLPPQDSLLRAAVLGRFAAALYFDSSDVEREQASQEAVAMARRSGDAASLVLVLRTRHVSLRRAGHGLERLAIADELLPLAERLGDVEALFESRYWRACALLELGEIAAAVGEVETSAQLASQRRQLNEQWESGLLSTGVALLRGRFALAEELAQRTLALGERQQQVNAAQFFSVQTFMRLREQDRLPELAGGIRAFAEELPQLRIWRCGLAFLHAEMGSLAEAQRELNELAASGFAGIPRDLNWLAAMSFLADTCAIVHDAEAAAVLYEQLRSYAALNVVIAMSVACRGSVAHFLGRLAETCGRYGEAAQHYESALAHNLRMGAIPALADTQFHYSQLLRRFVSGAVEVPAGLVEIQRAGGDRRLAVANLGREALGLARSVGMRRLERFILAAAAPVLALDGLPTASPRHASMRREDHVWAIEFAGASIHVAHTKGLLYLSHLLSRPGQRWHVSEILAAADAQDRQQQLQAARPPLPTGASVDTMPAGQGVKLVDSRAATQEAARRLIESQRVAVSKAITVALQAIGAAHPDLRRYLAATIHTGRYCLYTPSEQPAVSWHCS